MAPIPETLTADKTRSQSSHFGLKFPGIGVTHFIEVIVELSRFAAGVSYVKEGLKRLLSIWSCYENYSITPAVH